MITLTLEVTPEQLLKIAQVLNTSLESISEPTRAKKTSGDSWFLTPIKAPEPSIVKTQVTPVKSPGKGVKLPSFGRSQEQIDAFVSSEEERLSLKEEEAQLKAERKAQKEAEQAEKEAEVAKIKEEPADIIEVALPKRKPWEL